MTMIEKITKAIIHEMRQHGFVIEITADGKFAKEYQSVAKAAIAAMREPTDEMINEGNKYTDWAMGAAEAWQEMIDEALKE